MPSCRPVSNRVARPELSNKRFLTLICQRLQQAGILVCLTCESASGYLGKFIKSAVKHSWAQVFCTEDAACTVRRPAGAKRGSLFTSRSCISAHGGKLEAFHLIQPGMFPQTIKSPNICSRLCHQLSASRLLDKTFHRRLLVFVFCSFDLNPPSFPFQHTPPFTPAGLFVYCCDKRGKLIRRWQSSPLCSGFGGWGGRVFSSGRS